MLTPYKFLSVVYILFILFATNGCTTIPASESQNQQPSSTQQSWAIQYQRSGGIMGLAQTAKFTAAGARIVSNYGKPKQTLEPLNPSALAHLANLVNLASNEAQAANTSKATKCADCINETVQLKINGSMIYYANNTQLPKAQKELLKFLAEHTPMR